MNIEKIYAQALTYFQAGNLQQAELMCGKILLKHQRHVDALNMLGAISYHARNYNSAEKYLKKAIELNPNHVDAYINLGNVLQEKGQLDEAMISIRKAIQLHASDAEAQNIMGMILHKKGNIEGAIYFYQAALQLKPSLAHAHNNLGIALESKGLYNEAISSFQKAAQYDPRNFDACSHLGILLKNKGNLNEAITWFHKALQINPNHAATYNNLGKVLNDSGKTREAMAVFHQALRLNPADADAYYNLGTIHHLQKHLDDAMACYRKAIHLEGNYPAIYNNLGTILQAKGKTDEAITLFQQALQLEPEYAEAHYNLGTVLQEKNNLDDAIVCFRKAIYVNPRLLVAYNNLGNSVAAQGRLQEAVEIFHQALEISPDSALVLTNLGNVLKDQGKLYEAEASCRRAIEIKPDFFEAYSNFLFYLNYNSSHTAQTIFTEHARLGKQFDTLMSSHPGTYRNDCSPGRKLRVGYVSPDFREHSVAYFIEPVIKEHSSGDFEVICYSHSFIQDHVTERIKKYADHWRDITRIEDEIASKLIREDGIDILIDLTGHTGNNRLSLFAQKPAPVQVTWIGYPATTGLSAMDYKIVDENTDPSGTTEQYYTERLLRLPDVFLCYLPDVNSPAVSPLPAFSSGHITFGSFNNFSKISPMVFSMWQTILKEIPTARFVIKAKNLSDITVRNSVMSLFRNEGIADERVELLSWTPSRREHLDLYSRIDIALDTFPYHGTATTCEALYMGVPVITLAGDTHASRVGVSLLSNIELKELIANTQEDYIEIAVELARDRERLRSLRRNLRDRMAQSPLTDTRRFTEHLEKCYRDIWIQWCKK
jgi:predicted O-linked N-acetylglucosamine transferase (SPINDLY family)